MARDYAKRSSSCNRNSVPGWVWMTIGLMVGLFVAFLLYLNDADLPDDWKKADFNVKLDTGAEKPRPSEPTAAEKEKEPENAKLNFDFYNVLPEFEVPVPEPSVIEPPKTVVRKPPELEPAKPVMTPTKLSAPPAPPKPATPTQPGAYIIQAGSFSSAEDADTRRAQLALLGIVSRVQKVTIDGGKTYHRVQVGPFDNAGRIEQISKLLKENSIEYMLIRYRG